MTATRVLHRPRFAVIAVMAFALAALVLMSGCSAEVDAEMKTYAGVNAIRTSAGLPPLKPDQRLVDAARQRSNDMAKTGHFAHDRIGGCPAEFICVMDRLGIAYTYAGENIAWNDWPWSSTAEHAVTGWKNSPPHLENIMNCHYTRFGTGVARSADGKIWYTMIFEGAAAC